VESLAEIDPRKVAEVVRGSGDKKNNASATHFFALSPKSTVRFRWKRARRSLFRLNPTCQFHPNPSKFPRFIRKNDVPDNYNIPGGSKRVSCHTLVDISTKV